MPTDPRTLDYSTQPRVRGSDALAVIVPFAALTLSMLVVFHSFSRMDPYRLFWEGGHAYFLAEFPFKYVLGVALLGVVGGLATACFKRRFRGWAFLGAACNTAWAAWWARHLW